MKIKKLLNFKTNDIKNRSQIELTFKSCDLSHETVITLSKSNMKKIMKQNSQSSKSLKLKNQNKY
jgi:hypothetical protein